MRYRVEYLREAADEASVCQVIHPDGDLDMVEMRARIAGISIAMQYDACAFIIRDLADDARIVAREEIRWPSQRALQQPRLLMVNERRVAANGLGRLS